MDLSVLTSRAQMSHDIRAFFYDRNVLEVETPALSQAGNTDPSIESFQVQTLDGLRYLHTSPEYPMKRLLVHGSGDIYQICKVWRAGESGSRHNPEFTMLEWYRVGFTYHQLMQEVDKLLQTLLATSTASTTTTASTASVPLAPFLPTQKSQFISYQQLFLEVLGINPHIARKSELQQCMDKQRLNVVGELDHSSMLDILMTHCIEPELIKDGLTFVYDYPVEQKALAQLSHESSDKQDKDKPVVAQRFEVYLGSTELANGYQEQTDAKKNAEVLHSDFESRRAKGMTEVPVDKNFLAAMEQGLPLSSGVAIGLDRVLMCRLGKKKLQEVISFPWTMA